MQGFDVSAAVTVEQTVEFSVVWDVIMIMWRPCKVGSKDKIYMMLQIIYMIQ